ncbi:hypothetical protein [Micromonospora sp. NPDC051141]
MSKAIKIFIVGGVAAVAVLAGVAAPAQADSAPVVCQPCMH